MQDYRNTEMKIMTKPVPYFNVVIMFSREPNEGRNMQRRNPDV